MDELKELQTTIKNNYRNCAIILIITMILNIIFITKPISYVIAFIETLIFISTIKKITKLKKDFRELYKNVFVIKSLESKFTDLEYNPKEGIPYEVISRINMINMGDTYKSEDYISAKYKNIKFEQSDVHIQKEYYIEDSSGNSKIKYENIFFGRWMIFDFNKEFKSNIQIIPKTFSDANQNRLFKKKDKEFKEIYVESEEFNNKFNIYAQNEHEGFYIITPSLMEKIEKLTEKNRGKTLLMCFINSKLHIGLYDRIDSFEPESVFKQINEEEITNKISQDMEPIIQFIDELNLDNGLFKEGV